MAYSRTTTIDANPGGDTVKQAILDLDTDLTGSFANLNTHEALTTGAHGVTAGGGVIAATTATQTLTNKTLSAPTLTGTVTASGATITGGTAVNMTIQTPTLTGPVTATGATISGGTLSGQTITGTIPASGATIQSPAITGATVTSSTINGITITAATTGFTAAGGTSSKTLTVDEDATISNKMNKTGNNLAIGSDADGDMYYRASGVTARLAKGSDGQILKLASGAPSWAWGGKLVQVANYQRADGVTGTTLIPHDDTIPQNTEGDEYLTVKITPKSASNTLRVTVNCAWAHSAAGAFVAVCLFKDSAADAVCVASESEPTAGYPQNTTLVYYMTAGGTSEITFTVRAGADTAGTTTLNGRAGSRTYGGVQYSSITVEEYSA